MFPLMTIDTGLMASPRHCVVLAWDPSSNNAFSLVATLRLDETSILQLTACHRAYPP